MNTIETLQKKIESAKTARTHIEEQITEMTKQLTQEVAKQATGKLFWKNHLYKSVIYVHSFDPEDTYVYCCIELNVAASGRGTGTSMMNNRYSTLKHMTELNNGDVQEIERFVPTMKAFRDAVFNTK